MIKKSYIAVALLLCMTTGLSGCGEAVTQTVAEIELVAPSNASVTTEAAAYRNLYDAAVCYSTVMPYVEEYFFEQKSTIESFCAMPGDAVKAGEKLVYADMAKTDKKILELEEKIAGLDREYQRYVESMDNKLDEYNNTLEQYEGIIENLEEIRPEEYITGSDGVTRQNPEYKNWEKELNKYRWKCQQQLDTNVIEEASLRQRTELYELDRAYYTEQLNTLVAERREGILESAMDGYIVAVQQADYGTFTVAAEEPVVAVGDMSRKILKCGYINKDQAKKAAEIYAIVNGKKYELEYQPLDSKEYLRLTQSGETVYSTLELKGDAGEVQVGDFAAVVLVNTRRENVLAIPKNAIDYNDGTPYVYVIENGESIRRDIKTGASDGVYTEVLSGIEAGEKVKIQEAIPYGNNEAVVELGTFQDDFSARGKIYYSDFTNVVNPVEYGTAYYVESNVVNYQHVEKGDVIATVYVKSDEIALERKKVELQRLQERLQDVIDENKPEENKYDILDRQEKIAKLSETVAKMQQDAQTTQIVAPVSGTMVWIDKIIKDAELTENRVLAQIAKEDDCYILVENRNQVLQYGNEVSITYEDSKKQEYTATGMIANVSDAAVSKELRIGYAFVQLSDEFWRLMGRSENETTTAWSQRQYVISTKVKSQEKVLLVPRKAVTEVNGRSYVHVIGEDGEITARSIITGGYDSTYYWVIEGLTEGMKICSE